MTTSLNVTSKALLIGIDDYQWAPLKGCVADAKAMKDVLETHADGSRNFHCKTLTSDKKEVTESQMRKEIRNFFSGNGDIALLFFSGHGCEDPYGGYLTPQDAEENRLGLPFTEVLQVAERATHFREIFIILDCCHSGHMTDEKTLPPTGGMYSPRKGMSILTSSMPNEYSRERNGRGIFTTILEDGLRGNAADLLGQVTASGLYHYADRMLGPFSQRPMLKTHVHGFKVLRQCEMRISEKDLKRITFFFESEQAEFPLTPDYEKHEGGLDQEKHQDFEELQRFTRLGLVEPVGVNHMYEAAIKNKSCRLTHLGRSYWHILGQNHF